MDKADAEKEGGTEDDVSEGEDFKEAEAREDVEEEACNEAMGSTKNNHEVGEGGEEDHDTQDMDCKPFEADNGPSDDDTAAEQEQQQDKPVTVKGKKQKQKTTPHHGQEECTHSPCNEMLLSVDGKNLLFFECVFW